MPIARSAMRVVAALWMLSLTPSSVVAQEEDRFPAPVGGCRPRLPSGPAFQVPPSFITESLLPAQQSRHAAAQAAQRRQMSSRATCVDWRIDWGGSLHSPGEVGTRPVRE